MILLEQVPRSVAAKIRMIATDVDGTLTTDGALTGAVLGALQALADVGVQVVPVSGRPASEVAALCRYLPGVTTGISENGLIQVWPKDVPTWLCEPIDREAVKSVGAWLNDEHQAGLQLTPDDAWRMGDVAYVRDGQTSEHLRGVAALAQTRGMHLMWSSVHMHLTPIVADKGVAAMQVGGLLGFAPEQIATIGDAPNDAGLFRHDAIGLTVGTADVRHHLEDFPRLPRYVTRARESEAFIELANLLLANR